jgi:hypothetical protein
MHKVITSTTVFPMSEAIEKYDAMDGWELIVTGDLQTPEDYSLKNGTYISWKEQKENYPDLCDLIGPCNAQRGRLVAFIEAYRRGADIVAFVDDDNIPLDNWGKDISIGKEIEVTKFVTQEVVFDPLVAVKNNQKIWHRGFPLIYLPQRKDYSITREVMIPKVQENLWIGDPDVDSICRQIYRPYWDNVELIDKYISTNTYSPFNTQNTMIDARYLKDFFCLPWVGRADDFWGAYLFEKKYPASVVYGEATVRQDRHNEGDYHNDKKDTQEEILHYEKTHLLLSDLYNNRKRLRGIPKKTWTAIKMYRSYFE